MKQQAFFQLESSTSRKTDYKYRSISRTCMVHINTHVVLKHQKLVNQKQSLLTEAPVDNRNARVYMPYLLRKALFYNSSQIEIMPASKNNQ